MPSEHKRFPPLQPCPLTPLHPPTLPRPHPFLARPRPASPGPCPALVWPSSGPRPPSKGANEKFRPHGWGQKNNKQKRHKYFSDGPCGTIVPGTTSQGQTGQIGAKNWTQTFFSQTFRALPGYPGKFPGYPAKKVWFPGFRGTYRTFWPPPLHVEDPHPTREYPDSKV